MLLKFYFFRARFFTKKRQKTLCVTIRNFAQFYFVYLYAKITRFLINERRTYPYIQVGSFSVPSLAPLAPARKPCGYARRRGTFCAPDFTLLHTDFRLFCSIRNFAETARKSRCSPLTRLAKQRVIFCGPAFFAYYPGSFMFPCISANASCGFLSSTFTMIPVLSSAIRHPENAIY